MTFKQLRALYKRTYKAHHKIFDLVCYGPRSLLQVDMALTKEEDDKMKEARFKLNQALDLMREVIKPRLAQAAVLDAEREVWREQ